MRGPVPSSNGAQPTPAELLPIAMEAVDRASRMIRERPHGHITMKGDRDPASEVDYAVEREVRAFLLEKAPTVGFLGEEYGRSGEPTSGNYWALDPIDGTMNFIHGIPLCGISLGLVTGNCASIGIVDLPFLGGRYSALLDGGAHLQGARISVSDTDQLPDAIVAIGDYAVGDSSTRENADRLQVTARLVPAVGRIRMFGSAVIDLVWVAEGRIDGSVMLANKPWDTVAGVLIAREAGATVVDRDGRKHGLLSASTIAVTPRVKDDLLRALHARP